ncbi:MAG TPA: type II toxin-antitoxin system VapC family toxin [Deltaproteobacteria bacterium]|jgi:predicted nucleic acid-binding protein|nr:type II toxin-antitoxin system VapC family toxin [Deltaproteobacteria bacterium]OQC29221.1 MAG: hypothetical protein BWX71_00340 [Deltaproteobacteria bacterium ADurb.Bin072]HRW81670.1 type II toxin-antitoxin system VapC family toxin [Desulfomonilia bacterium]HNQ86119.1 type II toxin-antitoxin system VapC family toxin [Deltaproteobacteria bacterium]HNS91081.1 type II toxin-antitoxin system VapC family toxin [Deltaproteobacteria bacterium]
MIFWDSSAIIPLCVQDENTAAMREIAMHDDMIVTWWGSVVECRSAFSRLRREAVISMKEEDQLIRLLDMLASSWMEILPVDEVRTIATRLLLAHPLRAADSLQLAAALVWAGKVPRDHTVVCLDNRLRDAARKEGFRILPE